MPRARTRRPEILIPLALLASGTATVPAQIARPGTAQCDADGESITPDRRIALCTSVIESSAATRTARANAYYQRGRAHDARKEFAAAIADYTEAVRISPKMANAYAKRGDDHAELEQYDLAAPDYERAARLDPVRYGAGDPAVVAAGRRAERAEARSGREAAPAPPSAPAISFQELQALRKTLAEADAFDRRAQALYAEGRYAEAEPAFKQALDIRTKALGERDRATLASLNNYAIILQSVGKAEAAEPLLRKAHDILVVERGETAPETLDALGNLGNNLMQRGFGRDAEPLLRKALELRTATLGARAPQTLDSMNALGVDLEDQGRLAEAEALYRETIRLQTEVLGAEHPDTLSTIANLAVILMDQQRPAEAEPLIRKALSILTDALGERHQQTMGYMHNLAVNLREQGRFADAEPLFRKSLQLQTEVLGERHPDTLRNLDNLAADLIAMGRVQEAFPMFEKALKLQSEALGERHPETLGTAYNMALAGHMLRLDDQIEPLTARTFQLQSAILGPQHPQTLESAVLLAETRLALPTAADALTPARLAVAGWRSRQTVGGASAQREIGLAREAEQRSDVGLVLADAAWQASDKDGAGRETLQPEVFVALQEYLFGTTSRALAQTAARSVADARRTGLGALVRQRELLLDEWTANDNAQTKALGETGNADQAAVAQRLPLRQREIEAALAAIDTQLHDKFPDYFALISPRPLDIAASQALLKPDEAILIVAPSDRGTHLVAVTHDGFKWVRADWDRAKVDAAVRRLLWDVGADVRVDAATATQWEEQGGGGYPYDRKTAFALYRQIVAPVATLLAGKRHLFVAPGGSLTSIPFGIMVTGAPKGSDGDPAALRQTAWLADRFAITVIPSIQSLAQLRAATRAGPSGDDRPSFQGYGDPALNGTARVRGARSVGRDAVRTTFASVSARSANGIADISQLAAMAKLPGTAIELAEIGVALGAPGSAVHTQGAATEHAIKVADLSDTRILAFATHGLMAGEINGVAEPGLVFTPPAKADADDDGFLSTSEIAGLKLGADWVILSACNTATGDGSEGSPGLSGLARAFFYAGARNLLVSHWPVRDDVAARITVAAIKLQRANPGMGRDEALQQAMRAVRNDASHDTSSDSWAHPNAWAPFSLVGDGAADR